MKCKKRIDDHGAGSISFTAEGPEDLWHVYNILHYGDSLTAITFRKIQKESTTGSVASERKKVKLTIEVQQINYDPGDETIRVGGKILSESQYARLGSFHTIELALQRTFTITKFKWDSVTLDRVAEASDPNRTAEVGAIIMKEGLAHLCLITNSMTLLRSKVEVNIPRKRKAGTSLSTHDKAMEKFFEQVLQGVVRTFNFDVLKVILVASPGFLNEQYLEFQNREAVRRPAEYKILQEKRSLFLLCHSSVGHMGALQEILENPEVAQRLEDTKAAQEVKVLNSFFQLLKDDPDRAFYGWKYVNYAHEHAAIDVLLLSDSLFRSRNLAIRQRYVDLVEGTKEQGGQVKIFSSLHVSGQQLDQLTGVAALLRFPLPGVSFEDDEEEEEEEQAKEEEPIDLPPEDDEAYEAAAFDIEDADDYEDDD